MLTDLNVYYIRETEGIELMCKITDELMKGIDNTGGLSEVAKRWLGEAAAVGN